MFKRAMLFIGMNIAIIAVITVVFTILEKYFGLSLDLYWFNYLSIFIFSVVVWFTWSFISLALSKWFAKRAYDMTYITHDNASELDEKQRIVWDTVVDLSERNHINIPEVGIYKSEEPNAFATWRSKNSSLVAVSTGLLNSMEKWAIQWVVAHEMAHILNWDMVTMTLLQWVLNTFVVFIARIVTNIIASRLWDWLWNIAYIAINFLLQILFWALASILAMKFSRYREFKADEGGARFVGKEKMIAWLMVLKKMEPVMVEADDNLSAMKISSKSRSWIMSLIASHPTLDDRIKKLEDLIIN